MFAWASLKLLHKSSRIKASSLVILRRGFVDSFRLNPLVARPAARLSVCASGFMMYCTDRQGVLGRVVHLPRPRTILELCNSTGWKVREEARRYVGGLLAGTMPAVAHRLRTSHEFSFFWLIPPVN